MKKLALVFLLVSTSAFAQNPPAEYMLKVTPADVSIIGKALGSQPFNDVAPVLNKLQEQINEQNKPKVDPVTGGGKGGGGGKAPK